MFCRREALKLITSDKIKTGLWNAQVGFGLFTLISTEKIGGLGTAGAITGLELQLLTLDADGGAGCDGTGDKGVGANDRITTDDGFTAQNGSTGVDGHIVLNGGMTLRSAKTLSAAGGQTAKGHALIDLYVLTDDGGFTDDDTGTMVNKEVAADGCAGMDVNTGDAVGIFGHDAGQQRHIQCV